MATATTTTYGAMLKEVWPQEDVWELVLQNNVLFGLLKKETNFYENVRHIALTFGMTQGVGGDFSEAKANKAPSLNDQFKVTTNTYYSLFSVARKLIKQSQNKRGAILSALERESKMALYAWKRDIGFYLFRNGGGALAQSAASGGVSGTTIVLANKEDIRMFEKNMWIQLASDDGTGGAGVRTGKLQILSVTRSTATLNFSANVTASIPAATSGDFVFRSGNYNNVIKGVEAYITKADPGGGGVPGTLWGLDRTQDTDRLGGLRVTSTGLSPREAMMKAAMAVFAVGGIPDTYVLHTSDYLNLQLELQSAGVLVSTKRPAESVDEYHVGVTFDGIKLAGPGGDIEVFPDYNCQPGIGWMLMKDTWEIGLTGDAPYLDNEDGTPILRESDADSYEGRWVGDLQPYTEAPGFNARNSL